MNRNLIDKNVPFGEQVFLSPDKGNLIQQRNNGIYYGIEAPADTTNLYVDSQVGNDNNVGSKALPLRTIAEALKRVPSGQSHTVHLKQGQTHEWRSSENSKYNGKNRVMTFVPYGDNLDTVYRDNIIDSYHYYRTSNLIRPIIKFIPNRTFDNGTGGQEYAAPVIYKGSNITFRGIQLDTSTVLTKPIRNLDQGCFGNRDGACTLIFIGCDFVLGTHFSLIHFGVSGGFITLDACNILNKKEGLRFLTFTEAGEASLGARSEWTSIQNIGGLNTRGQQSQLKTRLCLPRNEWKNYITGVRGVNIANVTCDKGFGF